MIFEARPRPLFRSRTHLFTRARLSAQPNATAAAAALPRMHPRRPRLTPLRLLPWRLAQALASSRRCCSAPSLPQLAGRRGVPSAGAGRNGCRVRATAAAEGGRRACVVRMCDAPQRGPAAGRLSRIGWTAAFGRSQQARSTSLGASSSPAAPPASRLAWRSLVFTRVGRVDDPCPTLPLWYSW